MHLIGSRYIESLGIPFYRGFKDFDYLVREKDPDAPTTRVVGQLTTDGSDDIRRIEYHINPVLHDWIDEHGNSLEVMFTLKLSHVFWDVHWQKTMDDIRWYCGKNIEHIPKLLVPLYEHWTEKKGKRKEPKFNRYNDEFFIDKVTRKVPHDELHELVKFGDRPMFERIKVNLDFAEVSEYMFMGLSHDDRIKVVVEELLVLAIERFSARRILYKTKVTCHMTLMLMIQRLLPDWMALWTVLNFNEILNAGCAVRQIGIDNPHILKD